MIWFKLWLNHIWWFDLTTRRFDLEGCDLIWFWFELIMIDLWFQQFSLTWADHSWTQSSTTFTDSLILITRGATTFSKLGVQFHGLGYYYLSNFSVETEKLDRSIRFGAVGYIIALSSSKSYVKSWGVRPNFGEVRTPQPPSSCAHAYQQTKTVCWWLAQDRSYLRFCVIFSSVFAKFDDPSRTCIISDCQIWLKWWLDLILDLG